MTGNQYVQEKVTEANKAAREPGQPEPKFENLPSECYDFLLAEATDFLHKVDAAAGVPCFSTVGGA